MKINKLTFAVSILFIISSCSKQQSSITGWDYNNSKNGGFEVNTSFKEQMTGPGLTFVEGGSFTQGRIEQDVMYDWNNVPKRVTVSSFYLDETEVRNVDYREYLNWLKRVYGSSYPEVYTKSLPDTLVWRDKLGYNEPYVTGYLRHPAYDNYPVVGVSWEQANDFCVWRTDRVNEQLLVMKGYLREGAIIPDSISDGYTFNTKAYLLDPKSAYGGKMNELADDKAKETNEDGEEKVDYATREKGVLLPEYRLPTETEWEYAALALSEIRKENVYRGKKKFPWDGEYTRSGKKKNVGDQLANFKLSDGDYGGIAGWSETGSGITTNVRSYPPNDFGLYGMAGNVAEWTSNAFDEAAFSYLHDISSDYHYNAKDDDNEVLKRKSIRGGSWKDIAYFIQTSTRTFEYQDTAKCYIGFRCAVDFLGRDKKDFE